MAFQGSLDRRAASAMMPVLCIAVAMALAAGCAAPAGPGTPAAPEQPAITGTIESVTPADDGAGRILGHVLVVAKVGSASEFDRAAVTVTSGTELSRRELSGSESPVSFDDLAAGDAVDVWITGPVRESYPVQVDASRIVVVEAAGPE